MTRHAILCAALLFAVPAAAQDQAQPADTAPATSPPAPESFDLAKKQVIECEGEKFVFAWGGGARPTRVTLCSDKGATPEQLVVMLEDAAAKLEQSTGMAEDRRHAIIQQIRAKIAELKKTDYQPDADAVPAPAPPPAAAVAEQPVLTSPPAAAPPAIAAPVARAPAAVAARPRLTFACGTRSGGSPGECATIGRDTLLTLTARDALAAGTSLRFLRKGDVRAAVDLRPMRAGQSVQIMIPRALCAGVLRSEARIEVVSAGRVVDSSGPHQLRC
jgi:hypothetical protein